VGALALAQYRRHQAEVTARRAALAAVMDMDAATQVGVTYMKYTDLLVESNQGLQRARAQSPTNCRGSFWAELGEAMSCYSQAGQEWRGKIDADDPGSENAHEEALQEKWAQASLHLMRAQARLE
jgi:hypothetical protein